MTKNICHSQNICHSHRLSDYRLSCPCRNNFHFNDSNFKHNFMLCFFSYNNTYLRHLQLPKERSELWLLILKYLPRPQSICLWLQNIYHSQNIGHSDKISGMVTVYPLWSCSIGYKISATVKLLLMFTEYAVGTEYLLRSRII